MTTVRRVPPPPLTHLLSGDGCGEETDDHSEVGTPPPPLTHLLSGDGFGEETDDHSEEGTPPPLTHLLPGFGEETDDHSEEGTPPPPLNSPVVWGWVW